MSAGDGRDAPLCPSGKRIFESKEAARSMLRRTQGMASSPGRTVRRSKQERRTYRCDLCDGWHLTSQSRR